ncbi:hypothetical protein, partial [Burkholderia pseudomallei]|uniref:hypothetical protein n=1 Tax=Burkholderia pseudomallei TaxID=28450 RepID=UPI0005723C97
MGIARRTPPDDRHPIDIGQIADVLTFMRVVGWNNGAPRCGRPMSRRSGTRPGRRADGPPRTRACVCLAGGASRRCA